jgi:UDP-N-acetylglucosamine 1-carboxyvinyltransferase
VNVRTAPVPGFATDMQAQIMAVDCVAEGTGVDRDDLREPLHARAGAARLGADIATEGHTAVVKGVPRLSGAAVMATDLRASAGLVIAGLVADGETVVDRIYHLDRGYDAMEKKLSRLGARIERTR